MTRAVIAEDQTATMTAMRQESRLRAIYAVILAGSFSAITLGSAFPQIGDLIPPIAVPAGHFIIATGIFVILLVVAQQVSAFIFRLKIKRANLRILHWPSVRDQATELASKFGLHALVLRSGGPRDGHISALIVGHHSIVRIGTGALSLAVHKPQDFKFRLAHEMAHLWARDPLLDQFTLSSYLAAVALIAIGLLSVLWNVVTDLISHFNDRPHGIWRSWWYSEWFVMAANVVYFSVLGIGLFLERKSAMRLREFHADRVATHLVGPRPEIFSDTAATSSFSLRKFLSGLVESHPGIELRRDAVLEAARSLTGDSILFFLQGYFGALVLETLLQLLFVDASPTLVGVDVRRAHLADVLAHNGRAYVSTILLAAILMSISYGLVIARIRTTIEAIQEKSNLSRGRLLPVVLLLILSGSLTALVSSEAVLWGLKQTGWNLVRYARASYDLLSVHAGAFTGFCLATALAFVTQERRRRYSPVPVVLATLPILCATAVGMFLYYRPR